MDHPHMIGDLAHIVTITSSIFFIGLVVLQNQNKINIFDSDWINDGFCISNKDKTIWVQSHALSFYGDTITTGILWLMVRNL